MAKGEALIIKKGVIKKGEALIIKKSYKKKVIKKKDK
jgi:hypothetical protein